MIWEKSENAPVGAILRRRELQTELAEWVEGGARVWVRKLKVWGKE